MDLVRLNYDQSQIEIYEQRYSDFYFLDLFLQFQREIYRYSLYPGQALTYKIGELKIKELKSLYLEKYKTKTIKDFHKKILERGACPLDILENYILDKR